MGEYNGKEVLVMYVCGYDIYMVMFMGVVKIFIEIKGDLKGKVKFIFQLVEEGVFVGEKGGVEVMVVEGVFKNFDVDVIFGLYINVNIDVGKVCYNVGGIMVVVDLFKIVIYGK